MEEPPPWGDPEPPTRPGYVAASASAPVRARTEEVSVAGMDSAQWHDIVAALGLRGMSAELANNCSCVAQEGDRLTLSMEPGHDHLKGEASMRRFGEALSKHLKRPVQLRFVTAEKTAASDGAGAETVAQRRGREREERMDQARAAIYNDPNVKAMVETFDATVVPDSIVPIDTPSN
ncbi:MAG: DNA polymerase III subunit gamma/tau C-terminal domain-containing protein [Gammaproteobacteria bacterium]